MGTVQASQMVQQSQFKMMCEKLKTAEKQGIEEVSNDVEMYTQTSLRSGSILASGRILKCDLFPSGRDKSLPVQLEDAPNFRQSQASNHIFGSGQPGLKGLLRILEYIHRKPECGNKVVWLTMRQEPLVYINGRPYVVKDRGTPFQNLEFPGITPSEVDDMEAQLAREILAEAQRSEGSVLLHGERDVPGCSTLAAWGEIYSYWEPVGADSVLTSRQAFEKVFAAAAATFKANHHHHHQLGAAFSPPSFTYLRVPVADEKAPGPAEFDIVERAVRGGFSAANRQCAFVFNCQLGRGRATTGMILASMIVGRIEAVAEEDRKNLNQREESPPSLLVLTSESAAATAATAAANATTWEGDFESGLTRVPSANSLTMRRVPSANRIPPPSPTGVQLPPRTNSHNSLLLASSSSLHAAAQAAGDSGKIAAGHHQGIAAVAAQLNMSSLLGSSGGNPVGSDGGNNYSAAAVALRKEISDNDEDDEDDEDDEAMQLPHGVANVLLAPLLPVMSHGQDAMNLLDTAVQHNAHLQNLKSTVGARYARALGHGEAALEQLKRVAATAAGGDDVDESSSAPAGHHRNVRARRDGDKDAACAATAKALAKILAKQKGEETIAMQYLDRYMKLLVFAEYLLCKEPRLDFENEDTPRHTSIVHDISLSSSRSMDTSRGSATSSVSSGMSVEDEDQDIGPLLEDNEDEVDSSSSDSSTRSKETPPLQLERLSRSIAPSKSSGRRNNLISSPTWCDIGYNDSKDKNFSSWFTGHSRRHEYFAFVANLSLPEA